MCSWGGLLTSSEKRFWNGLASSLNCPAILILEFWSMGDESHISVPK